MIPEMIPGMTPALKEELIQWLHEKAKYWTETCKNSIEGTTDYAYAMGCFFSFGAVLDQLSTLGNRRTDPEPKTCGTCANWKENPEQCYHCNLNPSLVDRWRPEGSPGFTRDAGKPVNPELPEKDMIRFEWLMQYVNAPRDEIDKRMQYPEEKGRIEKAEQRAKLLRLFDFISEGQKPLTAEELKTASDSLEQKETM